MSTKTQIFITGATGYIAGSVLDRLLRHPTFATSEITVLIRKADKVPAFESLGVKTVLGSNDDHALLEKQASLSDVVFACADADNAGACAAILRGLKKRCEATGKVPSLIHTSGTGVIIDMTDGNYATETVWDDTDVAQLDTIADTQLHRDVDLLILAADKGGEPRTCQTRIAQACLLCGGSTHPQSQGYVKTYVVLPPTIYGFASGKLVDLGIQNTRSIQIPLAVASCIARKRGGYVGQGLNAWPNMHIDDVADLYIVVYDALLEGKAGHGREGFYFGENGHHLLKDVGAKIGEVLYDLGVSETPEPNAFTDEDYKQSATLRFLGTHCRCKASRARALGWKPKYTTEDMMKSIRGEVEWQLKHAPRA